MAKQLHARTLFFFLLHLFLLLAIPVEADSIGDIINSELSKKKVEHSNFVIVIDPGHGGKDSGAIGHKSTLEKDIVLTLSKKIRSALIKEMNPIVIMTRTKDIFISLEERDKIAVDKKADLFLSIHANAANNKEASGIEIYYLNNASDEAASRLATRENKASRSKKTFADQILSSMLQTESTDLSRLLAKHLKKTIDEQVASQYTLQRLSIKSALFYVLVGSKTTSILLEAGFVTNPKEASRLKSPSYQEKLAIAVAKAIKQYSVELTRNKINL
jgi:N-acetylmuramoyl-L-alanine amidase